MTSSTQVNEARKRAAQKGIKPGPGLLNGPIPSRRDAIRTEIEINSQTTQPVISRLSMIHPVDRYSI
jgi:hypothetical protein